jgi:hypothetical protein
MSGQSLVQNVVVLPGCAGAALAFAIDMEMVAGGMGVKMFADDVTMPEEKFEQFVKRCELKGKCLSKTMRIKKDNVESTCVIAGQQVQNTRAGRVLGAYLGEEELAVQLLTEHISAKLGKLSLIRKADVSCQAKWQMTRSLERSLVWDATATPSKTFTHVVDIIDGKMFEHIAATFLPEDTYTGHKSIGRAYSSIAHGGLGYVCFANEGEGLYDATTASINGVRNEDGELAAIH